MPRRIALCVSPPPSGIARFHRETIRIGQAAQPVVDLRVAQVVQHVAGHRAADGGREVVQAGDPPEDLARHVRGPLARSDKLHVPGVVEGLAGAGHPLREVDQMGGHVGDPLALNRNVEIPRRPHQRALVDDLVQVMDAFQVDGRLRAVGAEASEHLGALRQRLLHLRRDLVALGHDVHRQRRRGGSRPPAWGARPHRSARACLRARRCRRRAAGGSSASWRCSFRRTRRPRRGARDAAVR